MAWSSSVQSGLVHFLRLSPIATLFFPPGAAARTALSLHVYAMVGAKQQVKYGPQHGVCIMTHCGMVCLHRYLEGRC